MTTKPTPTPEPTPARKPTPAEKRAARAHALLRQNAVEAVQGEIKAAADLAKSYAKLEDWARVREQAREILAQCDAVDPRAEAEGEGG